MADLSDADAADLRALRARAYGPRSDIDATGLARLHELEDRSRTDRRTPVAAGADSGRDADSPRDPGSARDEGRQPLEPGEAVSGAEPTVAVRPSPSRARWMGRAAWAASGALVALGGAALVLGMTADRPAFTLETVATGTDAAAWLPDEDARALREDGDDVREFSPLGRATLVGQERDDGSRCLSFAYRADPDAAPAGLITMQCAPSGLDPYVELGSSFYGLEPISDPDSGEPFADEAVVRLVWSGEEIRGEVGHPGTLPLFPSN